MRDIVFYGAGENVQHIYGVLSPSSRLIAAPPSLERGLCFADTDRNKVGTTYLGLPVLSVDEAITKHPEAKFYVTLGKNDKYNIFHILAKEKNIATERIIGYVPVEKRISCIGDNTLTIYQQKMFLCWFDEMQKENEKPSVPFGDDYGENVENFLALTRKSRERRDEVFCANCRNAVEAYFPVDAKYRRVNWMEFNNVKCNFKCRYCGWHRRGFDFDQSARELDFPLLIKELRDRKLLRDNALSGFADGEITIHPKKSEYIRALIDNQFEYRICTNAGFYDDEIAELLKNQYGFINVSLDSGTRDYFAKIKGVDKFDQVVANCRRYTEYARRKCIELKYIFVAGKNCDVESVNGFVKAVDMINPSMIALASDFRTQHDENVIKQSLDNVRVLLEQLHRRKINVTIGRAIQSALNKSNRIM